MHIKGRLKTTIGFSDGLLLYLFLTLYGIMAATHF